MKRMEMNVRTDMLTLRVPAELNQALRQAAQAERMTLSELGRAALRDWLRRLNQWPPERLAD